MLTGRINAPSLNCRPSDIALAPTLLPLGYRLEIQIQAGGRYGLIGCHAQQGTIVAKPLDFLHLNISNLFVGCSLPSRRPRGTVKRGDRRGPDISVAPRLAEASARYGVAVEAALEARCC